MFCSFGVCGIMTNSDASLPDVSRAYMVTVPTVVTTIVALLMTVLRVYVRAFIIKVLGWDDFFNILATASLHIAVT